ncbi:hypothetical protein CBL_04545 [Carabus blaptoides fortunei]
MRARKCRICRGQERCCEGLHIDLTTANTANEKFISRSGYDRDTNGDPQTEPITMENGDFAMLVTKPKYRFTIHLINISKEDSNQSLTELKVDESEDAAQDEDEVELRK